MLQGRLWGGMARWYSRFTSVGGLPNAPPIMSGSEDAATQKLTARIPSSLLHPKPVGCVGGPGQRPERRRRPPGLRTRNGRPVHHVKIARTRKALYRNPKKKKKITKHTFEKRPIAFWGHRISVCAALFGSRFPSLWIYLLLIAGEHGRKRPKEDERHSRRSHPGEKK